VPGFGGVLGLVLGEAFSYSGVARAPALGNRRPFRHCGCEAGRSRRVPRDPMCYDRATIGSSIRAILQQILHILGALMIPVLAVVAIDELVRRSKTVGTSRAARLLLGVPATWRTSETARIRDAPRAATTSHSCCHCRGGHSERHVRRDMRPETEPVAQVTVGCCVHAMSDGRP